MNRILWSSVSLLLVLPAWPSLADEVVRTSTVEARDGEYLRLTLSEELGSSWQEAPVVRLAVRAAGTHKTVPRELFEDSSVLDLRFEEEGCSLVLLDVASPDAEGALSWYDVRHATKIVTCSNAADPAARLAERRRAGATAMAKVGGRIEIQPLANPATMRPGSDLPIRAHFDNSPRHRAEVEALGPEGMRLATKTDKAGFAHFCVPAAGTWRLRFRVNHEGEEYTAELRFEVLPTETWRSLQAAGGGS